MDAQGTYRATVVRFGCTKRGAERGRSDRENGMHCGDNGQRSNGASRVMRDERRVAERAVVCAVIAR
jgi:hypothetical protein